MKKRPFFIYLTILYFSLSTSFVESAYQSGQSIQNAAKDFLSKQFSTASNDIEMTIGNLDPRIRLGQCDSDLNVFMPQGSSLKANTIVGVRCIGETRWQIYLPVQLKVFKSVVVFNRGLSKGEIISTRHISLKRMEVNRLYQELITDKNQAIGATLKRSVYAGSIFDPSLACMICKGDTLLISVEHNRLNVSMSGIALEDGFYGETIRIVNSQSKKEVSGTVIAKNKVSVALL